MILDGPAPAIAPAHPPPTSLEGYLVKEFLIAMTVLLSAQAADAQSTPPVIPSTFESAGADRRAITALLDNYTRAVSTQDQRLFETLLLSQAIPFSSVDAATAAADREDGARNYPAFRRGVFEGQRFTQRFQDVQIEQDGALANVRLVFVNTKEESESWGWKVLHLLKVDGEWKIASEFWSIHR